MVGDVLVSCYVGRGYSSLNSGALIVIEGIDGAGKTSVSKEVVSKLNDLGIKAVYTYEPYTPFIVEIMSKYWDELDPIMQTLLMTADRYYHIKNVILPYIQQGFTVVSDRYYYSTLAYQGAQGVDINWILTLNNFIIKPTIAIYLDVEPTVGLSRKKYSTTKIRQLESDLELIRRARDIYLNLVTRGELLLVNAMTDFKVVVNEVLEAILKRLSRPTTS